MCPLPVLSKNHFLLPHVTPFTSNTPTQLSSIAPFPKHHSPQKMLKKCNQTKKHQHVKRNSPDLLFYLHEKSRSQPANRAFPSIFVPPHLRSHQDCWATCLSFLKANFQAFSTLQRPGSLVDFLVHGNIPSWFYNYPDFLQVSWKCFDGTWKCWIL